MQTAISEVVDGDPRRATGYTYEAMGQAKETNKGNFNDVKEGMNLFGKSLN